MPGDEIDGGVDLGDRGHRPRRHRLVDLPVALAVDADLGTGVVRLEDGDRGIPARDEIDRGGVPLQHEIEGALAVPAVLEHPVDILRRGDDLGPQRPVAPRLRVIVEQAGVIGRHPERQPAGRGLPDRLPFGRQQVHHPAEFLLVAGDVLHLPVPVGELGGGRSQGLQDPAAPPRAAAALLLPEPVAVALHQLLHVPPEPVQLRGTHERRLPPRELHRGFDLLRVQGHGLPLQPQRQVDHLPVEARPEIGARASPGQVPESLDVAEARLLVRNGCQHGAPGPRAVPDDVQARPEGEGRLAEPLVVLVGHVGEERTPGFLHRARRPHDLQDPGRDRQEAFPCVAFGYRLCHVALLPRSDRPEEHPRGHDGCFTSIT